MEERREEIKREFESDLARNVESFWAEKDSGFFGVQFELEIDESHF